jgi:V8-like Glu-specific endopeptidase
MPLIRVNRESVDDRFSVLGFTVRTESPLFEVGIATDPALFRPENRTRRSRRNFYSSRSIGAMRARRGEAAYLVPPDVLANFVGQSRLYFGLATYRENSGGVPDSVQAPTAGHMYVDLSGLTERGLRRLAGRPSGSGAYGATNGHDPSLDWGGDAQPQLQPQAQAPTRAATGGNGKAAAGAPAPATATAPGAPYDDGFGDFPPPKAAPAPAPTAAPLAPALSARALEAEDDANGIEGPVPDDEATAQAWELRSRALEVPTPEYPGASRFAPAHSSNYRTVTAPRDISQIVIHITDGGSRITGTIGWFQNPNQRNARNQPIHVSAHYVVGQDGEVVQMVRNNDVAWHASSANSHSIGIEHVANTRGLTPTEAEYRGSAALVAWLCSQYHLPVARTHVLGHAEADPHTSHTACPNAVWDWDHYMDCVREAAAAAAPAPTAQSLGRRPGRVLVAKAQEIITPFYDPADPASALTCQADAFSPSREEWFAGVPNTRIFPHSAICLLEMKNGAGAVSGYGTGFYVGPNRILTCAHNLRNAASVDVIPGCNDNAEPFGRFNVTSAGWRIPATYDGSGSFDLAVIDDVPNAAPGGVWFDQLEELNQSRPEGVVVCGYSRKSDRVPELTQAMNGRMQHLHAGYIAQLRNEVFDYPILTLHRASGSPVYYLSAKDGTMKAYVVGVHISGELAATENLNTGCRLTELKIAWIDGGVAAVTMAAGPTGMQRAAQRGAQPLSFQSFSLHWDDTPYQPQSSDSSCWAAAAAMVVGWRDQVSIADSDIAAHVPVIDAYRNGLPPSARQVLGDAWNLVAEPPASYTIEGFRRMLADHGPLYVGMNWDKQGGGHARVLVGMESGGADDGSDTTMFLYDPWPDSAGRIRMPFNEFVQLYEGRLTESGGTVDVQILHADSSQGRSPATAAPFALSLAATQVRAPSERNAARRLGLREVRTAQRGGAQALATETIEYPVQLVPQPNKLACWAASMAMLLSFRRNASYEPETLASEVGGSLMTSYSWDLLQAVRDRYGFTAIDVPSNASLYFSPAQWAQWLRDFGPLWVVIVGMPHAVVVSGLRGNTDDGNACEVKLLNPWDTRVSFDDDAVEFHPANAGYADWLPFHQFASDFGNMAEPDYGNWRVLHLPAQPAAAAPAPGQGASAQSLSASSKPRRSGATQRGYLATPPRQLRALSLEDATPPDETIEPSRVAGTTMRRQRGSRSRVTWALDQLDGVKLPDPAAAMVPALVPTTITLDQWPCVGHDAVPLPLTVRFDAGGGAVGNVRIAAGTAAELPYDVTVTATIEDDAQPLPGLTAPQAALRVTIDYDFNGTPNGDASARVKLRLVGNGRYDLDASWQ